MIRQINFLGFTPSSVTICGQVSSERWLSHAEGDNQSWQECKTKMSLGWGSSISLGFVFFCKDFPLGNYWTSIRLKSKHSITVITVSAVKKDNSESTVIFNKETNTCGSYAYFWPSRIAIRVQEQTHRTAPIYHKQPICFVLWSHAPPNKEEKCTQRRGKKSTDIATEFETKKKNPD